MKHRQHVKKHMNKYESMGNIKKYEDYETYDTYENMKFMKI